MTDGTAFRARLGRSIASGSNNDMSAEGSSRDATGAGGFLAAVFLVVVVDDVLEPADDGDDLAPALEEVAPVPDFAAELDFDVVPVFEAPLFDRLDVPADLLRPRSFLTLLVTELTSLVIPPSSACSPLVASFASAIVFSNSPLSSADIFRKSLTSFPACPITSGSLPGPKTSNAMTAMTIISGGPIPKIFIRRSPGTTSVNGVPVAARTSLKAITTATVAQCHPKYTATSRPEAELLSLPRPNSVRKGPVVRSMDTP
jgi:hypothetical protein